MKVLVFCGAADNTGTDPNVTLDPPRVRSYKLSNLYEGYFEYVNLLAAQDCLRLMKKLNQRKLEFKSFALAREQSLL